MFINYIFFNNKVLITKFDDNYIPRDLIKSISTSIKMSTAQNPDQWCVQSIVQDERHMLNYCPLFTSSSFTTSCPILIWQVTSMIESCTSKVNSEFTSKRCKLSIRFDNVIDGDTVIIRVQSDENNNSSLYYEYGEISKDYRYEQIVLFQIT